MLSQPRNEALSQGWAELGYKPSFFSEEMWFPEVRDFVYISNDAFSCEEIMSMEAAVVAALKWELTVPTTYHFLTWLLKELDMTDKAPLFMADCALVHEGLVGVNPSEVACACVVLAAQHGHELVPDVAEHHAAGLQQKILDLTGLRTAGMGKTFALVNESLSLKYTTSVRRLRKVAIPAQWGSPPP